MYFCSYSAFVYQWAVVKGFVSPTGLVGYIIQHSLETALIAVSMTYALSDYSHGWPTTQKLALLMETMVLSMKMHSYVVTNRELAVRTASGDPCREYDYYICHRRNSDSASEGPTTTDEDTSQRLPSPSSPSAGLDKLTLSELRTLAGAWGNSNTDTNTTSDTAVAASGKEASAQTSGAGGGALGGSERAVLMARIRSARASKPAMRRRRRYGVHGLYMGLEQEEEVAGGADALRSNNGWSMNTKYPHNVTLWDFFMYS